MPAPTLGQQGAFSSQVAHANSTLQLFVGGKQKPWMTGATAAAAATVPSRPVSTISTQPARSAQKSSVGHTSGPVSRQPPQ